MKSKQPQPDGQSYRTAILCYAERDQAMRQQYLAGGGVWDASLDADSTEFLRTIVAAIGWPTIRMVGKEASAAAWLLLQHSPDIDFMEHCLELMKAAPRGEVALRDIAFLEDRVCLLRGRPQIYGSQFQGRGKHFVSTQSKILSGLMSAVQRWVCRHLQSTKSRFVRCMAMSRQLPDKRYRAKNIG